MINREDENMIQYRHPNVPLPPPMMVSEAGSFAYQTVVVRLPAIVRRVLADNDFPAGVVKNLEALALELPEGYVRPIGYDGGPDVAAWNSYVQPFRGQRWLDLPWFFAEAYFYRRLLEATQYFSPGPTQGVDPYEQQ